MNRKAAIYCRVSTDRQADKEDGSLETQESRLRAAIASRLEKYDIQVFREEGESGKDLDRPALQRLLAKVRAKQVDLVIVTRLDRLSRSLLDFCKMNDLFQTNQVQFVSLNESFDTSTAMGRAMLRLVLVFAELERETTAERTKRDMRDRAKRGLFNGGPVPFGFRTDPDHKSRLRVVEEEAVAVRLAFDLYLELGSVAKVATLLKERGYHRSVRTSRRGKTTGGDPITSTALAHMLQNPVYRGMKEVNRHNRDLTEAENLALPIEDRYTLTPATWPALVDEVKFTRAQEMLEANFIRRKSTVAVVDYDYVLRGIIRCGTCGTVLDPASAKNQQYHTYRHPTGTRTPACGRSSHSAEVVESAVLGRLNTLATDPAILDAVVATANERIRRAAPDKERDLAAARTRLASLRDSHANLLANLMSAKPGTVPASFWEKAKELEDGIAPGEAEVARLEAELVEINESALKADDFRTALVRFRDIYGRLDRLQKEKLLGYLVDAVRVTDTHITVALVGMPPEQAVFDAFDGKGDGYSETLKWLPGLYDRGNMGAAGSLPSGTP